jgi:hypothetical protein
MVWDNLSCLGTKALARLGLRLGGFQLLFVIRAQDLAGLGVDRMGLGAREARHLNVVRSSSSGSSAAQAWTLSPVLGQR